MESKKYKIDPNQLMNEDADIGSTMHIVGLLNNYAEYEYTATVIRYEEECPWGVEMQYAHLVYANIKPEEVEEFLTRYSDFRNIGTLKIFNNQQRMNEYILDNPAKFV